MTSRMLPAIADNADYDIERCLPFVLAGQGAARLIFKLCHAFRRRGICSLFLDGSSEALHRDLQRCGAAFAFALDRDNRLVTAASKAWPFYDALACNDVGTSLRIAQRLPKAFSPGEEYEEDFYFLDILSKLSANPGNQDPMESELKAFGDFAETSGDPRFAVVAALVARDALKFGESMEALLQHREDEYARALEFEEVIEDEWATEGQFFVEGLSMVRMASLLGIETDDDYLFIPSLAIRTSTPEFSADSWREPFQSTGGVE